MTQANNGLITRRSSRLATSALRAASARGLALRWVEMNIEELKIKSERGSTVAQGILGAMYLHGYEVEINYEEAFRLLTLSAEKGAARSLWNLGTMYEKGLGTKQDLSRARELYRRATERGEALAGVYFARMYVNGIGGPVDNESALRGYKLAANQASQMEPCEEISEALQYVKENEK